MVLSTDELRLEFVVLGKAKEPLAKRQIQTHPQISQITQIKER
jgi:hypothetical protein